MVMRYAMLAALAVASLYAALSVGETSGQQLLVDAGHGVENPNEIGFWMLGAIAALTGFSLVRFVIFGIPTMLGRLVPVEQGVALHAHSGRRDLGHVLFDLRGELPKAFFGGAWRELL